MGSVIDSGPWTKQPDAHSKPAPPPQEPANIRRRPLRAVPMVPIHDNALEAANERAKLWDNAA